jgi:hypothetical protein
MQKTNKHYIFSGSTVLMESLSPSFTTSSFNLAVISVSINPGAITLQRILRDPNSKATDLKTNNARF